MLDTPASVILSPSYAGQHLNQYSVIAAIGLANRIRAFYRESHAATASNCTLPKIIIVITSAKLLLVLLTTLAIAMDGVRAQTNFDKAVDAERGWIGLATCWCVAQFHLQTSYGHRSPGVAGADPKAAPCSNEDLAFSDLRRLNDMRLDQVYTVLFVALRALATAARASSIQCVLKIRWRHELNCKRARAQVARVIAGRR